MIIFKLFLFISLSYGSKEEVKLEKATFAGGCFWCMEPPYEEQDGIYDVISGFSGGKKVSPTYSEVARGKTDHIESIQITYDPKKISYLKLLEIFWQNIDPTDPNGQFVDKGHQYTTAIFYHSKKQEELAKKTKIKISSQKIYSKPIVTDIREYTNFYPAEDYHQDFYKKNLLSITKYKYYRKASGRDKFINKYKKKINFTVK